jgi:predicted nucleic-acid-binding protein
MRAVDTNVLVRILTGDDARQCDLAEAFVEDGAWISVVVLAETLWTLSSRYGQSAADIDRAVAMLLSHDRLLLQDPDAVAAALEQFRAHPSAGFADCLILSLARKAGHLPLGTFDRTLGKLPGAQRL